MQVDQVRSRILLQILITNGETLVIDAYGNYAIQYLFEVAIL